MIGTTCTNLTWSQPEMTSLFWLVNPSMARTTSNKIQVVKFDLPTVHFLLVGSVRCQNWIQCVCGFSIPSPACWFTFILRYIYIYIVCFIMQTYKYVSDIYLDMKLYVTASFVCPETCLLSPCLMKKSCRQGRFRTQEPKTWGRELSVDGKLCQRALLQTNLP